MRIIETCPKCGHDIHSMVLTTNPPQEGKMCPNCGWSYIFKNNSDDVVRVPFDPNRHPFGYDERVINYCDDSAQENDPCRSCPNDPRNGGSGICLCTVPSITRNSPYRITCTTPVPPINIDNAQITYTVSTDSTVGKVDSSICATESSSSSSRASDCLNYTLS